MEKFFPSFQKKRNEISTCSDHSSFTFKFHHIRTFSNKGNELE